MRDHDVMVIRAGCSEAVIAKPLVSAVSIKSSDTKASV
jgi:hypothetical protein